MLQLLATVGITGQAATAIIAQAQSKGVPLTPELLKSANAVIDLPLADDRLRVAAVALQRNLDQFQLVRDLDIDDSIEPSPIFHSKVR